MTKEELRQIREELGYTQAEVARLLGYTSQTISHMEGGRKPITKAFAKSLNALVVIRRIEKIIQERLEEP